MRKFSISMLMISALVVTAFTVVTPQEDYIRKYSATAVREMYRSGVPASITLAQGLLESRYGQSELAVKGNNHFGIKCHDWTGKKMYYDETEETHRRCRFCCHDLRVCHRCVCRLL